MISREGDIIVVQGAVTVNNVVALTQQGIALLGGDRADILSVDLQQVTEVDSTAISMLLEWMREVNKKNRCLQFVHLPASLESLLQLYGVTDIISPISNQ